MSSLTKQISSFSELEWEDEMFQRSEALRRKIDFERLRSMYECKESITNLKNLESTIKSSYKRKQQSKHIAKKEIEEGEIVEGSDDEDDESTDKDNDTILPPMTLTDVTQKSVDGEDGDDDDKLFDSDEEEEITRRVKEKEIVVLEQSVEVEDPHEDWDQTNTIASCDRLVEFGDDINIRNIKKSVQEDITLTQRPSKKPTTDATKPVFQSMAEYQHFLKQEKQKLEFLQYAADDKQPATLGDFSRITLRRDHLTSTANEPYFSDYVTGSYVKYLLNPTATGYYKPVYRLCQVMGVIELPVAYNVPCEHSQFFVTNIGLVLSTGDYQLDHKLSPQRMDQVSNHSVLDEELKYYLKSVTNYPPTSWIQAFPIPRPALPKPVRTKRDVRLLHEAQKKWKNHVYSNEEIEWMVKKKAQANAASKEVNKSTNDSNATTTKSFVQHDKRRENPAVVTKLKYLKMGSTTSRRDRSSKDLQVIADSSVVRQDDKVVDSMLLSLDEIRERVKRRLGVDPIEAAQVPIKKRYLNAVCENLPPIGSNERELLRGRNAKSLAMYFAEDNVSYQPYSLKD